MSFAKLNFATCFQLLKTHWVLFSVVVLLIVEKISGESLRHLFLVYRHGDRAPVSLYRTDPNPASVWKEGLGQLTNVGKMQHYQLGNFLRQRYDTFLTDDIQEVYIRSSAVERCLESAASSMASLYQPKDFWVWNEDLNWQPSPIHSMPIEIDSMLTTDSICPEADKEEERIKASDEAQAYLKKHESLFHYLTNYTGQEVMDWKTADYVHNCLFIEKLYNLTIPEWVDPIWDELTSVTAFSFYIPFSTHLSQRLRGGSLVGDIVSIMENKVQKSSGVITKLNIYSTHDTVIAAFMSALGVFNNLIPPYFATVIIELHENGPHNHTVRMYYRNDTTHDPYLLTLPGCELDCPLGHFVRLTEDVIPINWKEECGLKDETQPFSTTALIVICSMGVVLVLLKFSMGVMLWLRCQKEKSEVRYHRVPELSG